MNKNLSCRKSDGKWWTYGSVKENQWGNLQASFKVEALEELVAEHKQMGEDWVNLSFFDKKPKQDTHNEKKANGYQPQQVVAEEIDDDINDEIPF